ncbi:hypothetical protein JOE26_002392 [Rhodococcus coprophilus]|uniref:Uncharacterized conserved protein n=1 Tax=Rhodococcus coprophilus TaxID=38310 RepID=A0A2X4UVY6_9NOCA|nr:hypothetical protein [Rhodococcus coprophilus]SQI37190.1 Uncharacterized conserved protein [Rhodococcus coprophilus]
MQPGSEGGRRVVHATTGNAEDVTVVRKVKGGPMLVNGPVRILTDDGAETESDRFVVAVCRCRRSALYPLCDTSHRRPARG